jgi:hypothetical protein
VEHSSPFAVSTIDIPVGAEFLYFEYEFLNPGDGDFVTLLLDDTPIWMYSGAAFFGNEFLGSGPIPIGGLSGLHTLTISLNGVGENNADFSIRGLGILSDARQSVPEPGTLLLFVLGLVALVAVRRRAY